MHAEDPGYATFAREITDIAVTGKGERLTFGPVTLGLVPVRVTHQVVGYLRRRLSGEVIDFIELDMPEHTLATTAVMYTITAGCACSARVLRRLRIPGALHAAEHAAIGLLPLVASCDRGDIGGLSTAVGPDPVGLPSVFVYDGYPGGAGFAERGFRQARTWLGATAAAIEACECPRGCPSCVQSPKCGNGNDPLDKAGAVLVLKLVLAELARGARRANPRTTTDPSTVDPLGWSYDAHAKNAFPAAQEMAACCRTDRNRIGVRRPQSRRCGRSRKSTKAPTASQALLTPADGCRWPGPPAPAKPPALP